MEDFRVDVIVGKGPGATAIPLELPPFTVVGATTRAGLLPAPLRDRFGFTAHLDYYDTADLDHDPAPLGRLLGVEADEAGIAEIASRSRGTPRIANRLLRRVRDWAQVHGAGARRPRGGPRGAGPVRRRRRRPRPARPGRARGAVPPVRRRAGRAVDPRGGRGGGVRHGRDGRRALPRARGLHRAHPAGPGGRRAGLAAPRARGAGRVPASRRRCRSTAARRPARAPGDSPAEKRARCPGQPRWWVRKASPRLAPRPGASGPNHCLPRAGDLTRRTDLTHVHRLRPRLSARPAPPVRCC